MQGPRTAHRTCCERVAGKSAEPDAALLLRPGRPAMSTPAVPFVAKRKPAELRWVDRPRFAGGQPFS
jgi:hypothetical protein